MKLFIAIVASLLLGGSASAQDADVSELPLVIAGNVSGDSADAIVTSGKIEAGLALAIGAARQYRYLSTVHRDSIVDSMSGNTVTFADVAASAGASAICFARTRRFVNLVRTEITWVDSTNFTRSRPGEGLAAVRYEGDSGLVADPAILASQQRALMKALGDSTLYEDLDTGLRTLPAHVVAVGGIVFDADSSIMPPWDLFRGSTLVSYDLAQTVVHELQDRDNLTIVDLDTRDSMYALAGLLMIANDRPVANTELRIMRLFAIDHIVIGTFTRESDGAALMLQWCSVEPDGSYSVLEESRAHVAEDTVSDVRGAVVECLAKLLPPTSQQDKKQ